MRIRQRWVEGGEQCEHVREVQDEIVFNLAAPPEDPDANASLLAQSVIRNIALEPATLAGNDASLRQQADTALATLRLYRDKASPTAADDKAILKVLVRAVIALVRLVLQKLDGTG